MDNIFYRVLVNDKVKIEPKYLSKDYRKYVTQKIKEKMEGVCTKHGYIKEGSIDVYKVAPGNIELIGLNGNVVFDVYYYADICNPLVGSIIKATVTNVNKFGILAEVSNILEIIIAKNSVNIQHDNNIDLEKVQIGNHIYVEVLGKKFELNDKKISVVGKVVPGATASSVTKVIKKQKEEKDEPVDDEEVEEVNEEDEEEEEEEEEEEDATIENEEEEEEFQKGGNEFFDSDEDLEDEEYEFYSEDEYDEGNEEDDDEYE